jgi:hypothetical protein
VTVTNAVCDYCYENIEYFDVAPRQSNINLIQNKHKEEKNTKVLKNQTEINILKLNISKCAVCIFTHHGYHAAFKSLQPKINRSLTCHHESALQSHNVLVNCFITLIEGNRVESNF